MSAASPASEKQVKFLRFLGKAAPATNLEAHRLITETLANPAEAARGAVQQMEAAVSGSGGHNATFHVACMLVHGFALSQAEALPIMAEFNQRCSPPWSERDLLYKLASAERAVHATPRGHFLGDGPQVNTAKTWGQSTPVAAAASPAPYSPRKLACEFDPQKLRALAKDWRDIVNVEWLANRSAHDPSEVGARRYLELLYAPHERVLVFSIYESQGQAFWPKDEIPASGERGIWYLAQPVNGRSVANPRTGKMSRRSQESVTEFRYLVLESDQADMRDWLGLLVQLPLRIEAIYTSGGKSVHALVHVGCRTHREWEDYVRALMPTLNLLGLAGVDPKTLTSVRLTRLPGCMRAGKLQKLLYVRPAAEVRPICDLSAQRDVVSRWLGTANRVCDGYEEATRELRRALWYYSPASEACRTALREIEADKVA